MRAVLATVLTAMAAVSLYGCAGDTTTTQAPSVTMNIVELAQATPSLSQLVQLLVDNNLTETLSGAGPFTVFAPDDDAFTAAKDVIAQLSPEQITEVLLYHVVPVEAKAADLTLDENLTTALSDHDLTVQTLSPHVTIHPDGGDDATVTSADNMATNGVVHIVNAVLVPDLAPAASTPAPAPSNTSTPAPAPSNHSTPAPATQNIVELAQATPSLSQLVQLLVDHNLTETLSGDGPFTVFAPNDAAFTAAQTTIAGLTDDQITDVLKYHVVAASAKAADLTQGETLPSVFTDHDLTVQTITPDVTIHPDGGADAKVVAPDNLASNGVVHIVDTVLVPALSDVNVLVA